MGEMHEMHEIHLAHLVMGAGFVFIIAGTILVLHQTINTRRGKRGRIHTEFSLRKWSFQSTFLAAVILAAGALLLGVGHFCGQLLN
jgi:hypothetical protein